MAKLELEDIHKSYGDVPILSDISLEINSGEFLVLIGPSGSGKSTLLRMIAGLEKTTAGRILVDGEDITDTDPSQRDLAMVFQSYALYPHMTVEENMSFALRMRGADPAEITGRVKDAVAMLDLGGLESRKPGQLSGGQRQRVAMGRCIVRNPKLFLFDEPLSNLDAKLRAQTRLEIRRLHERLKATSIFVTHDQVEAMTMADRIALLKDGHLQQVGTPQELYLKPANSFVATFMGSPEMNMLGGNIAADENGLRLEGTQPMRLPLRMEARKKLLSSIKPGGSVRIGVRPEHFELASADEPDALRVEVNAVEWLGREVFVFGDAAGTQVAVRMPEAMRAREDAGAPKPGERLWIAAAADCWHAFDAESGVNLLA